MPHIEEWVEPLKMAPALVFPGGLDGSGIPEIS